MSNEKEYFTTPAFYDWYAARGLPHPDNDNEILAHRIKLEAEKKVKREENFWKTVEKNIKFTAEIAEVEGEVKEWPGVSPQCIANPSDIKIGFRNA